MDHHSAEGDDHSMTLKSEPSTCDKMDVASETKSEVDQASSTSATIRSQEDNTTAIASKSPTSTSIPIAGQKRSLEYPSERLFALDPVEQTVHEIWRDHPGMGIKLVLEQCRQKLAKLETNSEETSEASKEATTATIIDKPRIRRAKERIPYGYIDPTESTTDQATQATPLKTFTKDQIQFVHQKLQERQQMRTERRFKEADLIQAGLVTMGVEIDDKLKTWTVRQGNETTPQAPSSSSSTSNSQNKPSHPQESSSNIPCEMCGALFPSRNLVFKHLRDPTSPCGNAIFVSGESLPVAPSTAMAKTVFRGKATNQKGKHAQQSATVQLEACLWMGDLPLPWTRLGGKYNRLRSMLRDVLPRTVPMPWIKKVVRKGYKVAKSTEMPPQDSGNHEKLTTDSGNNPETSRNRTKTETEYRGFAIVVFRDAQEAREVQAAVDCAFVDPQKVFRSSDKDLWELPSFALKVRPAQKDSNQSESESTKDLSVSPSDNESIAGKDPSLKDQFIPWSITELEEHLGTLNSPQQKPADFENRTQAQEASRFQHETLVEQLAQHYTTHGDPRAFISCQGKEVPSALCESLTKILQNLRWPAQHDRPSLSSERYLVLKRQNTMTDTHYADLKTACNKLMQWVDPNYVWSGIAVTKNFVASPHRDHLDTTFQYAISLGDFGRGGELCVHVQHPDSAEASFNHKVYVVGTHNKVARVDGRWTHWVRTWEGGDRYSLIFYDTSGQHATTVSANMEGKFCQIVQKEIND